MEIRSIFKIPCKEISNSYDYFILASYFIEGLSTLKLRVFFLSSKFSNIFCDDKRLLEEHYLATVFKKYI